MTVHTISREVLAEKGIERPETLRYIGKMYRGIRADRWFGMMPVPGYV